VRREERAGPPFKDPATTARRLSTKIEEARPGKYAIPEPTRSSRSRTFDTRANNQQEAQR